MKKSILIIEDEEDIRKDISKALRFSGFNTLEAIDGDEGINRAFEHVPDLIISDIMMPKKSGHDVLQAVQSNSTTSHIPFLFLSAKSDRVYIREGMSLGADDFITKPYDLDELIDAVTVRLKRSETIESRYLEKINNLRSSFSKTIPHEIRTPLNLILGLSDYIIGNLDSISKDDIREMLTNIKDSGKRLQRLFENYLFYSSLEVLNSQENEKMQLLNEKLEYIDLLSKDIISYHAQQYNRLSDIKMQFIDKPIKIGEKYFLKVLEEVLDNALKFSEIGTIINISTYINSNQYLIEFHDQGRGMTQNQINEIDAYMQFERNFYEQQGNGLGLTIVKKIVQLHHGHFQIISEKNKYTKVLISFPLA